MRHNSSPSIQNITLLADTFHLLGNPTRLRILFYCLPSPRSVGKIAQELELSQALVSHHLSLLRTARLVKRERRAKQVFYELDDEHVSEILRIMASHIAEKENDN